MNEGENLGTENTERAPVMSASGTTKSSKFFGARSYRPSRTNQATAQANYSAAQNIASNPNTPQFFSDAVMASTPAPVQTPRKSKIPIFIGLGALVLIIAVVVGVVAFLPKNGGTTAQETEFSKLPEDAQALLMDESVYGKAVDFEGSMEKISSEVFDSTWSILDEKTFSVIEKNYKEYDDFISKISAYDKTKLTAEQKELFDEILKTAESSKLKFEKVMQAYSLILKSIRGDDFESGIANLKKNDNAKIVEIAKYIEEQMKIYQDYSSKRQARLCSTKTDDSICSEYSASMSKAEDLEEFPRLFNELIRSYNNNEPFDDDDFMYDEILKLKNTKIGTQNEK